MIHAVYDTHVRREDGAKMHFDIVVPDGTPHLTVLQYGMEYLKSVGKEKLPLTTENCEFCHKEQPNPATSEAILRHGYHIYKLEGCP